MNSAELKNRSKAVSKSELANILSTEGFLTLTQIETLGNNELMLNNDENTVLMKSSKESEANYYLADLSTETKSTNSSPIDGYSYLLDMPIFTLTSESVTRLTKKAEEARNTLLQLRASTESDLWLKDLENLKVEAAKLDPKYK